MKFSVGDLSLTSVMPLEMDRSPGKEKFVLTSFVCGKIKMWESREGRILFQVQNLRKH